MSFSKTNSNKINMTNESALHPLSEHHNIWCLSTGDYPVVNCEVCKRTLTNNEFAKYPQKINSCGHIVCTECIVMSYLINLHPFCPVEDCNALVNPFVQNIVSPKPILSPVIIHNITDEGFGVVSDERVSVSSDTSDVSDTHCDTRSNKFVEELYHERLDLEMQDDTIDSAEYYNYNGVHYDELCMYCNNMHSEYQPCFGYVHTCGDTNCSGDCGVLACGCIDVCRLDCDK